MHEAGYVYSIIKDKQDSRLVIVLLKSSDENYLTGKLLYCMIIHEIPSLFKQGDFNHAQRLSPASRSWPNYSQNRLPYVIHKIKEKKML